MQSAFETVVIAVCAVGLAGAVVALLLNRRTWEQYGQSHMTRDSERPAGRPGSPAAAREREEEIRQLMEARNARRRRRGEPELDPVAELARVKEPAVDAELREEIRALVLARNHRRMRRGLEPLDVEAEIRREIAELDAL